MRAPFRKTTKARPASVVRNEMIALRCLTLSTTGPRARATAATAEAITRNPLGATRAASRARASRAKRAGAVAAAPSGRAYFAVTELAAALGIDDRGQALTGSRDRAAAASRSTASATVHPSP